MTVIDESKSLRNMLLEDDHDDLEFHPPRTNRHGAGSWRRKQQNFRFNEALAPDPKMDRIRDVWDRGTLFEDGGDALFKTRAGVGLHDVNGQIDVAKTETLLEQTGNLDLNGYKGPTGLFSYDKEDAIKQLQTNNALWVDGVIKPNGETMRTLKTQLTPRLNALAKAAKTAEAEKAASVEQEKPNRAQLADNSQYSPVMSDAQPSGLLGGTETKSDPETSKTSQAQFPELPESATPNTPNNSAASSKSASEKGYKQYLDATEIRFDRYEKIFTEKKYTNAAKFLKHFRGGSGAEVKFTRKEARNFELIRNAEARNAFRFETGTFRALSGKADVNKALKNLLDGGEPVTIKDWYDYDQKLGRSLKTAITSGPDSYLAFGQTKIKTTVTFEAWRVGDVIHIKGVSTNHWGDIYDFDLLQPGGLGARALQKFRGAKPFKFGATWQQEFSGTVRISNRTFHIPQIEWRDVE